MEVGNKVRLIQPVIQGEVIDTEYSKEDKCLIHLVEWSDTSGDGQRRWFKESELEIL